MSAPYTVLEKPLNNYSLLCRGCLAESGEMKNMYEWGLSEDFCKFTDIQLKSAEGMSELLCITCEEILLKCRSFRSQCRRSDQLLRNTVKNSMLHESQNEETPQENTVSCVLYDKKLVIMIIAPDMNSKVLLTCPYQCKVNYQKKKDLLLHLVRNHSIDNNNFTIELQYYCSHTNCSYHMNSEKNKWFTERKFLNQHFNKVHKTKLFYCTTCMQNFSTDTEFNRHLKSCNQTFLCEVCNTSYKTNERLLVHLLRNHPDIHKQYKEEKRANKRKAQVITETKKAKTETEKFTEYICDSPKRSFATQTLLPEENIKNDVTLPSWLPVKGEYETKTDEISTQTVFEDLLSLKSQASEDESIFFSETVSLSDIQTQTFPLEFGLSRSNKETVTSETQSPDLSIKETQTCYCLYDSPKMNYRLFDSISSSPSSVNLTSTETQTAELRSNVRSDVMLSFSSAETQTCFEDDLSKQSM